MVRQWWMVCYVRQWLGGASRSEQLARARHASSLLINTHPRQVIGVTIIATIAIINTNAIIAIIAIFTIIDIVAIITIIILIFKE